MVKKQDVAALRAEVLRAHKNTGNKLSRLRNKGVNVNSIDPRKDVKLIRRYTTTQLKSQLERLESFNDRRVQYVPGVRGKPINADAWKPYEKVQKAYNKQIADNVARIQNVNLGADPKNNVPGMTIGQHYETMVPKGPSMGGGSNRWFPLNRSSRGIKSEGDIQALVDDLQNRMKPGFQSEQETKIRQNFLDLLKFSDRPDLLKLAEQLDTYHFQLVWNFSPEVGILAENYHAILAMMEEGDQAMEFSGLDEAYDRAAVYMRNALKLQRREERAAKRADVPAMNKKNDAVEKFIDSASKSQTSFNTKARKTRAKRKK